MHARSRREKAPRAPVRPSKQLQDSTYSETLWCDTKAALYQVTLLQLGTYWLWCNPSALYKVDSPCSCGAELRSMRLVIHMLPCPVQRIRLPDWLPEMPCCRLTAGYWRAGLVRCGLGDARTSTVLSWQGVHMGAAHCPAH